MMQLVKSAGVSHSRVRPVETITITFIVVLATRLPFAFIGPGPDPDAWKLVLSARALAFAGEYQVSRFPGYPVVEIALASLATAPLWAFSLATAVMSSIAAGAMAFIFRDYTNRPAIPAILLFLFPVFYAESISGMDYMWALAFALIAFCLIRCDYFVLSGIFLGLATGARLTSVCMLPVILIYASALLDARSKFTARSIKLLISFVLTSLLFYSIPFMSYGPKFLTFYDVPHPKLSTIMYDISRSVGGALGLVLLVALAIYAAVRHLKTGLSRDAQGISGLAAIFGGAGYFLVYLRLPLEIGYLLPVIFFLFFYLIIWLPDRILIVSALLIATQSIVDVGVSDIGRGLLLERYSQAKSTRDRSEEISDAFALELEGVLIAGYLEPSVLAARPRRFRSGRIFYSLARSHADGIQDNGIRIFYVDGLGSFIENSSDLDLEDVNAMPLP